MKKLTVSVSNLQECAGGMPHGASVSFRVIQGERLLVEDSLSGRASFYRKSYCVDGTDGELTVEHDRMDLPDLSISAAFDS